MRANTFAAIANEGGGGGHGSVEGENLSRSVFLNRIAQSNLVGDLAGVDGVAVDHHFTAAQQFIRHHFRGDDGDDDFIAADDATSGGFGERQAIGLRAIDRRVVH